MIAYAGLTLRAVPQAVSHIITGISTATASALTDRARQRNIQAAHQSMTTIASNMAAASIMQPLYQFTPDYAEPAADAHAFQEQYSTVGSPRRHPAGSTAVTWEAPQPGTNSSNGRGSLGAATDDNSTPKASWTGGTSSILGPDVSLPGGRAGPAAMGEAFTHIDPELLVESLSGQLSRAGFADGFNSADPDDFVGVVQGPGAEAQLALQHATPGQLSRGSLAKIGQHAVGGQLFVAPTTSTDGMPESTPASPSRLGADAGNLELDMSEEELQHFTSVPATPGVHRDPGSSTSGFHARKPSFALASSSTGSHQGPASPRERGNRSLGDFKSRNSSMGAGRGAGEQGHVYSIMSELDLSQNPIGIAGAKAVAEVRHMID